MVKRQIVLLDTDGFTLYIKANHIYKDIAEDVKTMFDTSNYEINGILPKGKNKKVISGLKNELDGKVMIEFIGLRAKTYSYLIDGGSKDKIAKGTKNCFIKILLKFQDYKSCLEATQRENKINLLEYNEINKYNNE